MGSEVIVSGTQLDCVDILHSIPRFEGFKIYISLGIISKIVYATLSQKVHPLHFPLSSSPLKKSILSCFHQISHVEDHRSTPDGQAPPSCKCFQKH